MPTQGEVLKWQPADVSSWLSGLGFPSAAQLFQRADVDGETLLKLRKHELRDDLGLTSLKDRKAIWEHVAELQGVLPDDEAPDAGEEAKGDVFDAIDEIIGDTEAYKRNVAQARASVAEEMQLLDRNHKDKVRSVEEHFHMLQAELVKRREEVTLQLDSIRKFKRDALDKQLQWLELHDNELEAAVQDVRKRLCGIKGALDPEVADLLKQRLCSVERVTVPIRPVDEAFINCFMAKRVEDDVAAVQKLGYVEPHPQSEGEVFEHRKDFDQHGILYFFGQNLGRDSEYRNPGAPLPEGRQLLEVRASSVEYGTPHYAIAHPCIDPASGPTLTFLSRDEPGAWLSVHFGPKYLVQPSRYTIRNSTVVPGHSLSSWALEGSKDGHAWHRICEHVDSTALSPQRGSVATFDVIPRCVTFYHRLRVRLTGPNYHVAPHTRFHYLMLSGLEFYGTLKTVM
eukprot:TRINITY_DN19556_c0_g1_i1.p1 TRINITY_DN19556_c0_g1~~TRINITY_DN19556_c0_g1_i1.p1  ORF type:complete len:479 (+),score=130.45 TRINITY_DN19556_c0_g1_i1:78-1439(+)